jgi:hypothetical protein
MTDVLDDGEWIVIPGVQPETDDYPSLVTLAMRHDHGLRLDVALTPGAAEQIARNLTEAARAVRTGTAPNFAPRRST